MVQRLRPRFSAKPSWRQMDARWAPAQHVSLSSLFTRWACLVKSPPQSPSPTVWPLPAWAWSPAPGTPRSAAHPPCTQPATVGGQHPAATVSSAGNQARQPRGRAAAGCHLAAQGEGAGGGWTLTCAPAGTQGLAYSTPGTPWYLSRKARLRSTPVLLAFTMYSATCISGCGATGGREGMPALVQGAARGGSGVSFVSQAGASRARLPVRPGPRPSAPPHAQARAKPHLPSTAAAPQPGPHPTPAGSWC